jgi:hypothetical protein
MAMTVTDLNQISEMGGDLGDCHQPTGATNEQRNRKG